VAVVAAGQEDADQRLVVGRRVLREGVGFAQEGEQCSPSESLEQLAARDPPFGQQLPDAYLGRF